MMALVSISNFSYSPVFSRALVVVTSALFLCGTPAFAGCIDALLGYPAPAPSEKIFREAIGTPLVPIGEMPEEVLAHLAGADGADALWTALIDLKISSFNFGSKFKVRGIRSRVLTIKRPDYHSPEQQAKASLALARVLFREKQRQLRFTINPKKYMAELDGFTKNLESFVYAAVGSTAPAQVGEARASFGFVRYLMKAAVGMAPAARGLWPLSQEEGADWLLREEIAPRAVKSRAGFHFAVSRTIFAFYVSMAALAIAELPQAYDAFSTVYKLRAEIYELGPGLDQEVEFDGRKARLQMIVHYENKIQKLAADLIQSDETTSTELNEKIQRYKDIIASIREELAVHGQ